MDIEVDGFEIDAEIGRGGFGVVYRARQLAFDRPAAIKVLIDDSPAAEIERRFAQECRAVGALRAHPNVVTVYSTGTTTDGRPYLAMQYLGGGSLRQRIPLPVDTVVALGRTLADGLAAAHAGGVIHRDVKPANVLFGADDEPVLVDFGISSLVGDASLTGDDVALSLGYTPPEMFDGGRATPSVDVYSLGATLFAGLTGRTPFVTTDGYTSIPVLAGRILNQPLEDLRPLGVPDALCRVIETCMAKDPARRYASMAEVRAALTASLADDTVRRAAVLPAARIPAPRRRRRRTLVAAAAAALLLGGGVTAAIAASGDSTDSAPVAGRPLSSANASDAGAPTAAGGSDGPVAAGLSGAGDEQADPNVLGGPPAAGDDAGHQQPAATAAGHGPTAHGSGTSSPAPTAPGAATRTSVRTVTAPPRGAPPASTTRSTGRPPVLGTVPSLSANETYEVNTRLTASDPDGGPLTYRVTGLPLGVTASSAGVISGTILGRAATVTSNYRSIRSRTFALTVTVTDSTGRSDVAHKVWTVHDTRFTMPDYRGFRGCNGDGNCRENVRNVRQLGPHSFRCRVAPAKVGRIVGQSVRAGASATYGKTFYFVVGARKC